MSETKFTPGPWLTSERKGFMLLYKENKDQDGITTIAEIEAVEPANAKLIAAAPDMFDAIQSALKIKQLWAPSGDISIEHEGEAQALQSMLTAFETVIAKIN